MAFFRPRVSREAEVRHHADQEVGKSFPELLEKARAAEVALRQAQASHASPEELRAAGLAFDRALTEALRGAEASQRAAFGIKSYDDRIRRRKGRATPKGAEWTAEVNRLRTLREQNRLTGIVRVPRLVPASERPEAAAAPLRVAGAR
ncbi:hypothetical protein SAMN05216276_102587 [Streptosporangium subroseum]|uniref:Uncharacterized protein n=1 Tax=Streptosporangium subroseum TaxID=106412 RepID=A0A239K594_9ACTN|nr:hypothetical protein [Streptosporangium subroseum]SNT12813.1 hypothetical protein SAMN05216276_102587 [Streptosporangium subroseum]